MFERERGESERIDIKNSSGTGHHGVVRWNSHLEDGFVISENFGLKKNYYFFNLELNHERESTKIYIFFT